eukprot:m.96860 g.96860  ORF g.96860 m.96860 type:complete len:1364 (-) comp13568_c0_seq3:1323-5414(-)
MLKSKRSQQMVTLNLQVKHKHQNRSQKKKKYKNKMIELDPVLCPDIISGPHASEKLFFGKFYRRAERESLLIVPCPLRQRLRTFLESNSNADTGAQVALPPEEEEEEQVDPSLIAQGYNLPKLKKKQFTPHGIYYDETETTAENVDVKPATGSGKGGKKAKKKGRTSTEKPKLMEEQLKSEIGEKRLFPFPQEGATLPREVSFNSKHPYTLPYDIWWEYAHGILARKFDELDFKKIRSNVGEEARADPVEACHCNPRSEFDKFCGDTCQNRMMYIECSPATCPCASTCTNRRFQERQSFINSLVRFHTEHKGTGLKTKMPIPKGGFVSEYYGEVMTADAFQEKLQREYSGRKHFHCMTLDANLVIDGGTLGGEARFINHSCDPNCTIEKWNVLGVWRIGIFANRNIHAGEELSYDYNFQSFGEDKPCHCGAKNCRGRMGSKEGLSLGKNDTSNSKTKKRKKRKRSSKPLGLVLLEDLRKPIGSRMRKIFQEGNILLGRNIDNMRMYVLGDELRQEEENMKREALAQEEAQASARAHVGGEMSDFASIPDGVLLDAFKSKLASLQGGGFKRQTRILSIAEGTENIDRAAQLAFMLLGMMDEMMKEKSSNDEVLASPFVKLPSQKKFPEYYKVILEPIDLATIRNNLKEGQYMNMKAFAKDINRCFSNAIRYNRKKSSIWNAAKKLQGYVRKKLKDIEKITNAMYNENNEEEVKEPEPIPEENWEDNIQCICERFADEGEMIQCDTCHTWQHVDCVGARDLDGTYECFNCTGEVLDKDVKFEEERDKSKEVNIAKLEEDVGQAEESMNELTAVRDEIDKAIETVQKIFTRIHEKQSECSETSKSMSRRIEQANAVSIKWRSQYHTVVAKEQGLAKAQKKQERQAHKTEFLYNQLKQREQMFHQKKKASEKQKSMLSPQPLSNTLIQPSLWLPRTSEAKQALGKLPAEVHPVDHPQNPEPQASADEKLDARVAVQSSLPTSKKAFRPGMVVSDVSPPNSMNNANGGAGPVIPSVPSVATPVQAVAKPEVSAGDDIISKLRDIHLKALIPALIAARGADDQLVVLKDVEKRAVAIQKYLQKQRHAIEQDIYKAATRYEEVKAELDQIRCVFYRSLSLEEERYRLDDCVYVIEDDSGKRRRTRDVRPRIFRIEKLWRDSNGFPFALGTEFIRADQTRYKPTQKFHAQELMQTTTEDVFSLKQIIGICFILHARAYVLGRPLKARKEEDVYVSEFKYNNSGQFSKLDEDNIFFAKHPAVFSKFPSPRDLPRGRLNDQGIPILEEDEDEDTNEDGDKEELSDDAESNEKETENNTSENKRRTLNTILDTLLAKIPLATSSGRVSTALDKSKFDLSSLLARPKRKRKLSAT